jgi:dihydrofolate reductase
LTFEEWPYQKPVFVLSRLFVEPPGKLQNQAQIINRTPSQLTAQLEQRGFKNLYIDGGQTITSFLREDLIDEMIITTVPILLGDGIPLFGCFEGSLRFVHKKTTVYSNSLVKSHYIRA